jgi:ATP-dependent exoDNAse (exonuclease V) alpha subunit
MRGEIIDVSRSRIMIRFDSGLEASLPVSGTKPLEIDHGYAQTGHSAQGLGAETVILDLPSNSQTLNRRSFYTNLTRTKGVVIAFTDDREKLTGAVTREKDKTMAHDVEKAQAVERKTWERARKIEPELEI